MGLRLRAGMGSELVCVNETALLHMLQHSASFPDHQLSSSLVSFPDHQLSFSLASFPDHQLSFSIPGLLTVFKNGGSFIMCLLR